MKSDRSKKDDIILQQLEVIRTMSDAADDAADTSYDNFIDEAAHTSASIILKMLELSE